VGIPVAVLVLILAPVIVRWLRSGKTPASAAQLYLSGMRWLPGVRGALRHAHWSRFAHLLAVLLDAGVPFVEAARLSASAIGDDRVVAAIDRTGRDVAQGQPLAVALDRHCNVPPMLRWLMKWGERDSSLAPALREAAAQYAQRAMIRAELIQRFVPLAIVALVGGGITVVYALTVFVPLTSMWEHLATNR